MASRCDAGVIAWHGPEKLSTRGPCGASIGGRSRAVDDARSQSARPFHQVTKSLEVIVVRLRDAAARSQRDDHVVTRIGFDLETVHALGAMWTFSESGFRRLRRFNVLHNFC